MERFEGSLSLCNGEDTRDLLNGSETLRDTTGGGIQRLFLTEHISLPKNISPVFLFLIAGQVMVCLVKTFEQKKRISVREMKRDCVVEN